MVIAEAFNAAMLHGRLQLMTAMILLYSQLLLVVVGGPWMVKCQAANDHVAIELAHATPCDDAGVDVSVRDAIATLTTTAPNSTPGSFTTSDCVDTSLTQPTVLRQEDRSSLEAMPLMLTYQIAELPAPAFGVSDAPSHVFSPDSPESLARNVILLI